MKILIVEDDAAIRLELARFLEKYGYTCLCPADFTGIAAKAAETQPDLALLDINLPCQDGFSLCRQLRESPQTAGLPIIMLTSRTSDFDELLGLRVGADDYVTKPFNPQVFSDTADRQQDPHKLSGSVGRLRAAGRHNLRGLDRSEHRADDERTRPGLDALRPQRHFGR